MTGLTMYVIPRANPDGYAAGTTRERGRMNGNRSRNALLVSRRGSCINVKSFSTSTISAAVTTLEKWGASPGTPSRCVGRPPAPLRGLGAQNLCRFKR
jgi:hypothetical protein